MIKTPVRMLSVDVFRAITMFFMIFVNELSGAKHIPEWIDHVEAEQDGLGFADTIFPAFLFIVGLSIPLAISNKQRKGEPVKRIFAYIIYRAFALLLMGVYQVNMDTYDKHNWLPRPVWAILATLGFFLIWLNYKPDISKSLKNILIASGYALLIVLGFIYKGYPDDDGSTTMSVQWWGILGLIGWAYLVSALVYLFTGGRLKYIVSVFAVFLIFHIAAHTLWDGFKLWIIADASCICLTMAGIVARIIYGKNTNRPVGFICKGLIAGAVLIFAGLLIRPYSGGISKIYSTPAWVYISTGISAVIFAELIYLVDIKGRQNWFRMISAAGTATLTCYLIPYLIFFGMRLFHINYPESFYYGAPAILRSFAMTFLVIFIAAQLQKHRLTLKL